MEEKTPIIETQPCGRCGGTGKYSYCQMHGHTCFGCGGSGKAYTKRGKAVAAYWQTLTTIKAEEIEVGMRLSWEFCHGMSSERITATIAKVEKTETMTSIVTAQGREMAWGTGSTVRLLPKGEALQAMRVKATAYRDSLTLQGKPRKKANAEAA